MKTAPMVRLRLALSAVAVIVVLASAPQPSAAATWWTPLPLLPDVPFASTANALFGWLLNNRPTPRLAWRAASGLAPTHVKHMAFDSIFHQGTHEYRNLSAHYSIGYDERQMHTAGERGLPPMRTVKARTWKPRNTAPYLQAHRVGDDAAVISESQAMDWDEIEVDAPDVSDRKTLLALAKMASKAYEAPPGEGGQTWSFGGSQKWNLVRLRKNVGRLRVAGQHTYAPEIIPLLLTLLLRLVVRIIWLGGGWHPWTHLPVDRQFDYRRRAQGHQCSIAG